MEEVLSAPVESSELPYVVARKAAEVVAPSHQPR